MNPPREVGRFIMGFSYSPSTQIKPGDHLSPSTEIKPGERRSPATEFKSGQAAHNRLPVGTTRIRRETHTGLLRAWVKIKEPNVWIKRAVLVWESINGPLTKGWVVHHRDRDSLNDSPGNLIGMTRRKHAAEHRVELKARRRGRYGDATTSII